MNLLKIFRTKKPGDSQRFGKDTTTKESSAKESTVSSAISQTERTEDVSTKPSFDTSTSLNIGDSINDALRTIPELALACEQYYAYPLQGTHWLEPLARMIDGRQAFIVAPKPLKNKTLPPPELKTNYVFGKGRYGYGYYHLMTEYAWKILYQNHHKRITHSSMKRLLKQRANSKYRKDVRPDHLKTFCAPPGTVRDGLSPEAQRASRAMSSSVSLAVCVGI